MRGVKTGCAPSQSSAQPSGAATQSAGHHHALRRNPAANGPNAQPTRKSSTAPPVSKLSDQRTCHGGGVAKSVAVETSSGAANRVAAIPAASVAFAPSGAPVSASPTSDLLWPRAGRQDHA